MFDTNNGDSMMEREHIVAAVVAAGGGQLISHVRLQKTFYLLEQLGLQSGFKFYYHHFGPYSAELESALLDAKAFDLLEEETCFRQRDGARYSVFRLKQGAEQPDIEEDFGRLSREEVERMVRKFSQTNITILELAATIDWLWRFERSSDWHDEISRRKNVKVQGGRLQRAIELLEELGLAPEEAAAA